MKANETVKRNDDKKRQETFGNFSLLKIIHAKNHIQCGKRKEEKLILNRYRNGLLKAMKEFHRFELKTSKQDFSIIQNLYQRRLERGNAVLNKYLPTS